jgi:succinate-semialdehyde dehydrogenase/glutarate-semialdehyde dehydrogenase
MAGNAVLLKPEYAAGHLHRDSSAADLPDGILQVLSGRHHRRCLVDSAIDKSSSPAVRTGRKIAEAAARRFLPFVLELGGKDAMIVCADAPFERTVNGALWGAFTNCGQTCAAVERLYVVESIAERFINAVVEKTKALRVGVDGEQQKDIGPLNNARQLEIVTGQVSEAIARGAKVLTGGQPIKTLPGYFFEPTILVNVNNSCASCRRRSTGVADRGGERRSGGHPPRTIPTSACWPAFGPRTRSVAKNR